MAPVKSNPAMIPTINSVMKNSVSKILYFLFLIALINTYKSIILCAVANPYDMYSSQKCGNNIVKRNNCPPILLPNLTMLIAAKACPVLYAIIAARMAPIKGIIIITDMLKLFLNIPNELMFCNVLFKSLYMFCASCGVIYTIEPQNVSTIKVIIPIKPTIILK